MYTCQSVIVSQMWRISKCSSSPTDELSYSEKTQILAYVCKTVDNEKRTFAVDHVRAFFGGEERRSVREVDKN